MRSVVRLLCKDCAEVRASVELISVCGGMSFATTVYHAMLSDPDVLDSTTSSVYGARAAFAQGAAIYGPSFAEPLSLSSAKSLFCADVITLMNTIIGFIRLLTADKRSDRVEWAMRNRSCVSIPLPRNGRAEEIIVPLDFRVLRCHPFLTEVGEKRRPEGLLLLSSRILTASRPTLKVTAFAC